MEDDNTMYFIDGGSYTQMEVRPDGEFGVLNGTPNLDRPEWYLGPVVVQGKDISTEVTRWAGTFEHATEPYVVTYRPFESREAATAHARRLWDEIRADEHEERRAYQELTDELDRQDAEDYEWLNPGPEFSEPSDGDPDNYGYDPGFEEPGLDEALDAILGEMRTEADEIRSNPTYAKSIGRGGYDYWAGLAHSIDPQATSKLSPK